MSEEAKSGSFISKFHSMLKNRNFERIIRLDERSSKIIIADPRKFQEDILPYFFRHRRINSFIRQLNLYGFKKVKGSGDFVFTHDCLIKGDSFTSITHKKKSKGEQDLNQTRVMPQATAQISQRIYREASIDGSLTTPSDRSAQLFPVQYFPQFQTVYLSGMPFGLNFNGCLFRLNQVYGSDPTHMNDNNL